MDNYRKNYKDLISDGTEIAKNDKSLNEYGVNKSWCLVCVRVYNNARAKKGRYKLW